MFSSVKKSSNNNPYGLSGPELNSVTNGGNYPESSAAQAQRLETQITMGQARIQKLQGLVNAGHTTEPAAAAPLPAAFQAGGKFALSAQEQAWATNTATTTTTPATAAAPLAAQLAQKQQHVASWQQQLAALK